MSAKEYSLLIEHLLCSVNSSICGKSDDILLNPYEEIISAIEHRVPQEKLDKFKLLYQGIKGQKLQNLIDENYNIDLFLKHLKEITEEK